jgi:hypothetical protein
MDYSKTIFSQGLVCLNTNNKQYCVVIDGRRGTATDRAALVMEFNGTHGFMIHTPPNRALVPTGQVCSLKLLAKTINENVIIED